MYEKSIDPEAGLVCWFKSHRIRIRILFIVIVQLYKVYIAATKYDNQHKLRIKVQAAIFIYKIINGIQLVK